MNPLFLLYGLLGFGVFNLISGGDGGGTTTTTAAATKPPAPKTPAPPPVVDETPASKPEPEPEPEPEPQEPVGQQPPPAPEPQPEPEPEPEPEPQEPVGQQPPPAPEPQPEPEPEPEPEPQEPVGQQPPPAPEPQPEPEPEQPAPQNPTPEAPEQTGDSNGAGGETAPLTAQGTVSVYEGRVATLEAPGDNVVGIRILDDVDHGTLTVNPDNTMALVMTQSDFIGSQSFRYEATYANGSTSTQTVNLNVQSGLHGDGWGTGDSHYMLATDADDRVIVESGETHTKVYIASGNDGLSIAEVAAAAGVSQGAVNGAWLAQNGYGQSEATALDPTAGMMLWNHVTPAGAETSNWLLLERGGEYDIDIPARNISGESEMNPVHIGAWGQGAKPELTESFSSFAESIENFVIQDVHFSGGVTIIDGRNVIFDNVSFSGNDGNAIMSNDSVTIRNSDFVDIVRDQSLNGGDWDHGADRVAALYAASNDGLRLEGNLFDKTGWDEGFDYNGDGDFPQAPSMWSHNIYIQSNNTDVTLRDTITMRAASSGAQVRSGGFLEDNVFIDNNVSVNFAGGGPETDFGGNYTLFADNIVTSAGFHDAVLAGGRGFGADTMGYLSTLLDNIVAHLADPNNPAEIAEKTGHAVSSYLPDYDHYYDDMITYNWANPDNTNIDGLNTNVLDQTTIQLFAEQLLGSGRGTIEDLAEFLAYQARDGMHNDTIEADDIIDYFQQGFGIVDDDRTSAETVRFVPDDLGDGVRWDNRLNWSTEDLPGSVEGDSVDLGGNHVVFNGNAEINTLTLGNSGELDLYGGRLTVTDGLEGDGEGAIIALSETGQLWTEGGGADNLEINVEGGRFANTGNMVGADLTATGGEVILATGGAEYGVGAGDILTIGGAAEAGFDGDDDGLALLSFHDEATLALTAENGELGSIGEFRSGAFGDEPDVSSGIDLGGVDLDIDLSGLGGNRVLTLMEADEIVGGFDATDISGLGGRNAEIVIDYESDTVTVELTSGSGNVSVNTIGSQNDVSNGDLDIWTALTDGQGVFSDDPEDNDLIDVAA